MMPVWDMLPAWEDIVSRGDAAGGVGHCWAGGDTAGLGGTLLGWGMLHGFQNLAGSHPQANSLFDSISIDSGVAPCVRC